MKTVERITKLTVEQRLYDDYVLTGSGDVCFIYGAWGHCGPECPDFGMRDGCRDLDALEFEEDYP